MKMLKLKEIEIRINFIWEIIILSFLSAQKKKNNNNVK